MIKKSYSKVVVLKSEVWNWAKKKWGIKLGLKKKHLIKMVKIKTLSGNLFFFLVTRCALSLPLTSIEEWDARLAEIKVCFIFKIIKGEVGFYRKTEGNFRRSGQFFDGNILVSTKAMVAFCNCSLAGATQKCKKTRFGDTCLKFFTKTHNFTFLGWLMCFMGPKSGRMDS